MKFEAGPRISVLTILALLVFAPAVAKDHSGDRDLKHDGFAGTRDMRFREMLVIWPDVFDVHNNSASDGRQYVLQARCTTFDMNGLEAMGEHMTELPEGWIYRVRVLDKELVLDLKPGEITGVGDEIHQYYPQIPERM